VFTVQSSEVHGSPEPKVKEKKITLNSEPVNGYGLWMVER
jgi:hypothetical protein